ncbi:MAG: radical SAM family heme chaperone HemW [Geobacteraceae bacterium]|nr:radical SAM family heme chaperone HemW [Geobacteraceae bacterium]
MDISLYIHYPFCLRKCLYCAFNSVVESSCSPVEYVEALLREMVLRSSAMANECTAVTLYFGGGTPSLLSPSLVGRIVDAAAVHFSLKDDAEITLECNPGTVDRQLLAGFRAAGINRLSLGVQSFDDGMLQCLGRIHTSREAFDAFMLARETGFTNLGIDLIHSLPQQSPSMWERELLRARDLGPEHISVYGLSVEEGTPFAMLEKKGMLSLPGEDDYVRMFELSAEILCSSGFEHYEISNFARPGFRSRHNTGYWERLPCQGLGAGAHSFMPEPAYGARYANPERVDEYLEALGNGKLPRSDPHILTLGEAMAERMFLGLRMTEGVNLQAFEKEFGISFREVFGSACADLFTAGLLETRDGFLRLSSQGLLLSNQVFIRFL